MLLTLGRGAAWLVALAAMIAMFDELLGPGSLAAALLGALAMGPLTARVGVRWDRDADAAPREAARRVAAGAALALGMGGLVVAIGGALGWFEGHGAQPSAALAFAIARAAAMAARDELLFCGIPLATAASAHVRPVIAQAFAGLASGAAITLVRGVTPEAVALAVASGWFFAAIWTRDRGAWGAVGAHTAWLLLLGSLLHGGLFDLEWNSGELVTGAHAAGAPAWLATVVLVAAGFAVRRIPWPGRAEADHPRS
jgi:hypothetical protein